MAPMPSRPRARLYPVLAGPGGWKSHRVWEVSRDELRRVRSWQERPAAAKCRPKPSEVRSGAESFTRGHERSE